MCPLSMHLEGIVRPKDFLAARHRAPVGECVWKVDGLHVVPDQCLGLDIGAQIAGVGARPGPSRLEKLVKLCR